VAGVQFENLLLKKCFRAELFNLFQLIFPRFVHKLVVWCDVDYLSLISAELSRIRPEFLESDFFFREKKTFASKANFLTSKQ
jgi:hypothetical protein